MKILPTVKQQLSYVLVAKRMGHPFTEVDRLNVQLLIYLKSEPCGTIIYALHPCPNRCR